jgi:hypothetical protein
VPNSPRCPASGPGPSRRSRCAPWANECVYRVRKMWHAARRAGVRIGRDQVSTGGDAGDESSRQLVPTPADSEHRDRDTHPWRRPYRT